MANGLFGGMYFLARTGLYYSDDGENVYCLTEDQAAEHFVSELEMNWFLTPREVEKQFGL